MTTAMQPHVQPGGLWLTKELSSAGFYTPDVPPPPRLAINSGAREKKGKTHFACTAPQPIVFISLDSGTAPVVRQFTKRGARIALVQFSSIGSGGSLTMVQADYQKEWIGLETAYRAAVASRAVRTLVVDTGTQMWELLRLAVFGKASQILPNQYGPLNQSMRSLVNFAYETREDLNLIFLHKYKKEYKTNSSGKDAWTGRMEWSGFSDMPFLLDLSIEHTFDAESKQFGIRILDTPRDNYQLVGEELEGPMCDFSVLASLVFPHTKPSDWR